MGKSEHMFPDLYGLEVAVEHLPEELVAELGLLEPK